MEKTGKRGRPRTPTKRIEVYLPPEAIEGIDARAAEFHRTRAQEIEHLVAMGKLVYTYSFGSTEKLAVLLSLGRAACQAGFETPEELARRLG